MKYPRDRAQMHCPLEKKFPGNLGNEASFPLLVGNCPYTLGNLPGFSNIAYR